MDITFIFTKMPLNEPHVLKRAYRKTFEVPDLATEHPSFRERIMDIAHAVDALTDCFLFLTCPALGLKEHLISKKTELSSYGFSFRALVQRFKRVKHPRKGGFKIVRFVI
jgi:hypothetical protein